MYITTRMEPASMVQPSLRIKISVQKFHLALTTTINATTRYGAAKEKSHVLEHILQNQTRQQKSFLNNKVFTKRLPVNPITIL